MIVVKMKSFADLQRGLGSAWSLNRPGSQIPHVMVAMPSFSVGESLLSHYADRIPPLEHRYLLASLMLHRIGACEMVFISTDAPDEPVLDYYLSLIPEHLRRSVKARLRVVAVRDRSHRSVAAKLLDQPDLLARLRESFDGRPAFIEPWNVTADEVEVARRLGAPINGTAPQLWSLGYKSSGRRIFAEAGAPMPYGCEGVRTVEEVAAAATAVKAARPDAPGVVVKHDDSGAGDGNIVIHFDPALPVVDAVHKSVASLPDWYLRDLRAGGGVVEELIRGGRFTSPSAQVDITPYGEVAVLATHEQVLSGDTGQVYTGCRFPADPAYAPLLGRHAIAVGEVLANKGVVGRFSVDFAAVRDGAGAARVYALEINLRKGGTTHPYAALRNLTPGSYDDRSGTWRTHADGSARAYCSTDNLVDPAWTGVLPATLIRAVAEAGLQYDHRSGTGVVLHMLSCLAVDGRFGVTAFGRSPQQAQDLYAATERVATGLTAP